MKRAIKATLLTIVFGIVGIYLGALLNLEGYLGIIFAIATMGYFIIEAIENKNK